MRTSITFRLLLLTNSLVLVTVAAVAVLAGRVSATVVEDRLVRDAALRTARFLQSSRLPPSNMMMRNLRQVFGGHFVATRVSGHGIVGTSFPSPVGGDLQRQLRRDNGICDLRIDGTDYRVGSHQIRGLDAAGKEREPARLFVFMPCDELKQAGRLARARTFLAAAPAVVVATVLGLALSLTIIRPIRRLSREMDRITALHVDGPQETQSEKPTDKLTAVRGPREVVQLAASFERLLARLAGVQEELIRSQRLAALGKVAASAVHELKNPLSSIKMQLRLLQDETAPGAPKEDVDTLLREVDRMDLYLQELTDLATGDAAEAGTNLIPPGSAECVDLSESVSSVLSLLEGRCRHAGVGVRCDFHAQSPLVLAVPGRLRQVLMNLLINAVEAMPGGGTITVSTRPAPPGRVRLSVTDTGDGIRIRPRDQVFDLFYSTKGRNAGLGLYIARQLVLAQGGEIGCENADQGAVFWVELPVAGDNAKPTEQDDEATS